MRAASERCLLLLRIKNDANLVALAIKRRPTKRWREPLAGPATLLHHDRALRTTVQAWCPPAYYINSCDFKYLNRGTRKLGKLDEDGGGPGFFSCRSRLPWEGVTE